MSEPTKEIQPTAPATKAPQSFQAVLEQLKGKVVTMVNPESFEDAAVGNRLVTGFYKAKITFVGDDYLELVTEFAHKRGEQKKEPVKQYIPLDKIKRISLMKTERLIHI